MSIVTESFAAGAVGGVQDVLPPAPMPGFMAQLEPAAEEIGVERVGVALGGDGLDGGGERLAEDLPAEDRAPAEVLAAAAEQVAVEAFEAEQRDQVGEEALHALLVAQRGRP